MHNTWELPNDVSVIVHTVECMGHDIIDFDFHKDGQVIPMLGGTDEDGKRISGWVEVGIRKVDRIHYENLS
jgi:hypothetical protein